MFITSARSRRQVFHEVPVDSTEEGGVPYGTEVSETAFCLWLWKLDKSGVCALGTFGVLVPAVDYFILCFSFATHSSSLDF